MKMQITQPHENCEHCDYFRDFSIERFLIDNKKQVLLAGGGYGGHTDDGVQHETIVRWVLA